MSRWSVRMRTALSATAVVAVALAGGGVLLLALLSRAGTAALDQTAAARAADVAALAARGPLPPLLAGGGDDTALTQVIDARGRVLASTGNAIGEPPVLPLPAPGRPAPGPVTRDGLPVGDAGQAFRVVVRPVTLPGGERGWVYVAASLTQLQGTRQRTAALLAAGAPALLLVVFLAVRRAVAAALRPVEQMRERAAAIGGGAAAAADRVPVPGGRDEVARLAATLNGMLERLQAAAVRQRRFVGDASHELRSPLTALQADLDAALADPGAEPAEQVLLRLRAQVERTAALLDDLLVLARADEGGGAARVAVDLDDLVRAEAARLRAQPGPRVACGPVEPVRLTGSPRELARVLRNLGDNARAHAREEVRLSLRRRGGQAELVVVDDGPGIPAEERDRVLHRFVRLEEARTRPTGGGGSGLGLAIVADLVRGHGGTVEVRDRSDGRPGACLLVRLPATTG